jgi:hypothetical protein
MAVEVVAPEQMTDQVLLPYLRVPQEWQALLVVRE